MSTFNTSNGIGKDGEALLNQYWKSRGMSTVDLSSHKVMQKMGVDMALETKLGSYLVDVKSDTHSEINFAMEIVSNLNTNENGCLLDSQADRWYYYYQSTGNCYVFSPKEMREYVEAHSFREVKGSTRGYGGKILYESLCVLVPIDTCPVILHKFNPQKELMKNRYGAVKKIGKHIRKVVSTVEYVNY